MNSTVWHYDYSGLGVRSALELPEWSDFLTGHRESYVDPVAPRHREPDVTISFVDDLGHSAPLINPHHMDFVISKTARYRIRDGREIHIVPMPGIGNREIRSFLLSSAWAAVLYQRGLHPLHASVIQTPYGAVAFCGPSGSGKSSLAAFLSEQGHALISDDLSRVDAEAGRIHVWPGPARFKLWRDTLEGLGWCANGFEPDCFRMEKFHVPHLSTMRRHPARLRAIYLLAWGEMALTRLRGSAAMHGLVNAAIFRPRWLDPMGLREIWWRHCATIAGNVPVHLLQRPKDWSSMRPVHELLCEQWNAMKSDNIDDKEKSHAHDPSGDRRPDPRETSFENHIHKD